MILHLLFKVPSVLSSLCVGCEWVNMFPPLYIASTAMIFGTHNSHVPVALCLACMTRMDTVRLCVPNQVAVVNCLAVCSWSGGGSVPLTRMKELYKNFGCKETRNM
jgi:hypothetical protein